MSIRIERLSGPEAFGALTPEWDVLDASLSPRTPFTTSLWNTLWWKHFRAELPLVRDEFFAHVVRNEAGQLMAVAPMMLTHRPARGPLRARALQFFGTDPNMTEIRGLACRPTDEAAVVQALVSHFISRGDEWDWMEWGGIREGEAHQWFSRQPGVQPSRATPDYFLRVPDSWEAFKTGLSRNVKESLRKCYNSLKRDGHSFTVKVIERPDEVAPALDRFFTLHASRAQASDTIRHNDVFKTTRARQFFCDYSQQMAERGLLRIFQLEIAGQIVASRVGMIFGEELYLYYSGYDVNWAKYSVMTTAVAEAIKWAIEHRFKVVNLSTGSDVSKTRWSPHEVVFSGGMHPSPTRRGRIAHRAYHNLLYHYQRDTRLKKLLTLARRDQ
jgi:CelD/BcsL family acetyltransferase involved in cellulose biosynthesis